MFQLRRPFFPNSGHLQYLGDPKAVCRCPNFSVCAILRVALGPPCTDLTESKPVVHNFIGWTMTNLQLMCHFLKSPLCSAASCHELPCLHQKQTWLGVGSFLMLNACSTSPESLDQFVDNPLRHDTVPILH
jgi:hypothetical protein